MNFHPISEILQNEASKAINYIARYYENVHDYPVRSQVEPGYLRDLIPENAPTLPESLEKILEDVDYKIMPGLTHWLSPNFFAYFPASASNAALVGEILCSGLNVVGFNWISSPAATELESIVMDWIGKLLNLPQVFLFSGGGGGVMHVSKTPYDYPKDVDKYYISVVAKVWDARKVSHSKDLFFFYCTSLEDRDNLLSMDFASYKGAFNSFKEWHMETDVNKLDVSEASVWVRVEGLPTEECQHQATRRVLERVGRIISLLRTHTLPFKSPQPSFEGSNQVQHSQLSSRESSPDSSSSSSSSSNDSNNPSPSNRAPKRLERTDQVQGSMSQYEDHRSGKRTRVDLGANILVRETQALLTSCREQGKVINMFSLRGRRGLPNLPPVIIPSLQVGKNREEVIKEIMVPFDRNQKKRKYTTAWCTRTSPPTTTESKKQRRKLGD
uniref:Uncharacterized protein n=1 Tax=Chenopodium quinoa TaxID=63459 RepID=A0A803MR15_CHEQI